MTDVEVIPMVPYLSRPQVFVPLEGQSEDAIELVCTAEDWHWTLDRESFAEFWPEILTAMRAHQTDHVCQT
jgi:hypothetical protein